ncbi:DUF4157 domain-containing protein [Pedobacter sp. Hv1]|uniref:eCIS core domain-containing protein n=1 Tax=Pedobacter sp. Hv1 TaxID=1740090 RepID=UPI0009EB1539|nr:DUF4157 domain-containing protein [Pedobacter sp. Hv1]
MNTHADKSQENKTKPASENSSKSPSNGPSTLQLVDNRPEAIAQRKLQEVISNNPLVKQLKTKQKSITNSPSTTPLPNQQATADQHTVQRKENHTGLPDHLKSGIENLSGYSLDDVKVHYNSNQPAQLQAHAYAQGTNIHLAVGQEKHLAHEAWHVVQQKQGRVKPTVQMKGNVNVNDDAGLEKEADLMGAKAMAHTVADVPLVSSKISSNTVQRERMQTRITGTTHLVHALHGSIFNGTQGKLLPHGTPIDVETSDKIRSRLGPNAEIFRHYDAKNAPEYRWVRVISVAGELQRTLTYVRDDTFIGGANIPRGSAFAPAIDHRGRTQPALPERVFAPKNAPEWYERGLGHDKSSTAHRKHAKLLAVAFNSRPEHLGPSMLASAKDPDTGIALETLGQHLTHVTPWIPSDVEHHGKDRHENLSKPGEYFRSSPHHPLHHDYERHQRVMGVYKEGVTTEPVNIGWEHIASTVMGVPNMKDKAMEGPMGIRIRMAEHPDRIARGPGAVIGHEEMARETAIMRHKLLIEQAQRDPIPQTREHLEKIMSELRPLKDSIAKKREELDGYTRKLDELSRAKVLLLKSLGPASKLVSKTKAEAEAAGKIAAETDGDGKAQAETNAAALAKDAIAAKGAFDQLIMQRDQMLESEAKMGEGQNKLHTELQLMLKKERELNALHHQLVEKHDFFLRSSKNPMSDIGPKRLQDSRTTDLRPLTTITPTAHRPIRDSFANHLLRNRRQVKLEHFFGGPTVGPITDRSGREHPNLVLHNGTWIKKEDQGVEEIQKGWNASGLRTNLQVRGSFGHHRPSISPLLNGMIRINPGLYPMSLLQIGIGSAIGAKPTHAIDPRLDFVHRAALNVAVHHALSVIAVDRPSKSGKIHRIKEFAKHSLMINLLKAQTILKAHGPNPRDGTAYITWLEKDFTKTAQALENLNESTHLLLSARVNEERHQRGLEEPLMLRLGPFRQFVSHTFAKGGRVVHIYYVASGMQAITTGAIAAVDFRRKKARAPSGKNAGYIALHPYFEMKGATAAAAGFKSDLPPETIIADLSPLDTTASVAEQSHTAIRANLHKAVSENVGLVPVLDATTIPLDEVPSMVPDGARNYIIVESLTKYAQLGSDKALGGRIIVVGTEEFLKITSETIGPVEQNANMIVSRVWFESMENMRHSH